jgi:polyhydroxyalkanoate synthase
MVRFLYRRSARSLARIIAYAGESGVGLQHLALLVGRNAHDQVWPDVTAWLKAPRFRQ